MYIKFSYSKLFDSNAVHTELREEMKQLDRHVHVHFLVFFFPILTNLHKYLDGPS